MTGEKINLSAEPVVAATRVLRDLIEKSAVASSVSSAMQTAEQQPTEPVTADIGEQPRGEKSNPPTGARAALRDALARIFARPGKKLESNEIQNSAEELFAAMTPHIQVLADALESELSADERTTILELLRYADGIIAAYSPESLNTPARELPILPLKQLADALAIAAAHYQSVQENKI